MMLPPRKISCFLVVPKAQTHPSMPSSTTVVKKPRLAQILDGGPFSKTARNSLGKATDHTPRSSLLTPPSAPEHKICSKFT
jgi:hypothetical protein